MDIERHQLMDSTNFRPIISRVVAHGDRVYVCGITGDPVGDVTAQTRQALGRIDQLLAQAGTDKSKLLTAQVWLSDMALFRTHNLAWNEWVDPANPPARACVQAELTAPGLLVEIMVTAAR
jgi:enamine deaminase RidA (YjgF/YER057c/UK114 family)